MDVAVMARITSYNVCYTKLLRELRPQVFKMFTTLRRRDETEHTGIGLALVKKLVTRYGGEVWVRNNFV